MKKEEKGNIKELVSDRFSKHLNLFTFFVGFSKYYGDLSPDVTNIVNLVTLGTSFDDVNNVLNISEKNSVK